MKILHPQKKKQPRQFRDLKSITSFFVENLNCEFDTAYFEVMIIKKV